VIQGPQTAIVVGKKGEEIDTDEFGRVKLQFHWDRYGQLDENSSCWIRVSHGWAGKSWGAINIPRIGQEVIVEFLEGDPDQPIITGRVYNGLATTPYKLPDNKTRSTLKSNSSKGGNGFNEIRFEDKKGCEQIFIHAEKDEDIRVKADARESVGGGRHLTVGGDQKEKVDGEKHLTVKGDQFGKIEGDECQMVTGHQFFSVDLDHFLTVKGVMSLQVKDDVNLKGKNLKSQAETKISITAGSDIQEKAGNNYALAATNEVHIKGKTIVIEADSQLSLKVGGSFIDIGSSAVAITGGQITMNCGGSPASGSGSSPDAPDAPVLPDAPKEPAAAADDKPGAVDEVPEPPKPPDPAQYSDAAHVLKAAAVDGKPFCEQCDKEMEEEADKGDLDEEVKEDDDELLGEDSPEEDESPASS
jgi:type VI secretion system secreted protein VgrG